MIILNQQIEGFDVNGNRIERLLSTAIRPAESSAPQVNVVPMKMTIREGDSFELKCLVESQIPVKISWSSEDDILIEKKAT